MRMSSRPNVFFAAAIAWRAVSSSRASPVTMAASLSIVRTSEARASRRSRRRAVSTSFAPSDARARAQACPIPALAPVISATFPVSFCCISCVDVSGAAVKSTSFPRAAESFIWARGASMMCNAGRFWKARRPNRQLLPPMLHDASRMKLLFDQNLSHQLAGSAPPKRYRSNNNV